MKGNIENMNKYIEKIINKYPNYDFSKFVYINSKTKSIIICPEHGEFFNNYLNLIRSGSEHVCPKCRKNINRYRKEEACINDLKKKFPKMLFHKSEFKGFKKDIIITCPKHGDITNKYNKFMHNIINPCIDCVLENHKNSYLNLLIKKFPDLDFSKFNYINRTNKSTVICKIHGEFESSYMLMMNSKSKICCPKCFNESYQIKEVYMKFLIDKFPNLDFSEFEYVNYTTFSKYRCKIHGLELTNTYGRLKDKRNTYGCPKCKTIGKSRPEEFIASKIKEYYNKKVDINNINTIKNERTNRFMELDIYIPDIKLAIEYNGKYWHTDKMIKTRSEGKFNTAQEYHDFKTKMCEKENIHLIHIDENDWLKDSNKILEELEKEIKSRV